jgi:hypothetical protein
VRRGSDGQRRSGVEEDGSSCSLDGWLSLSFGHGGAECSGPAVSAHPAARQPDEGTEREREVWWCHFAAKGVRHSPCRAGGGSPF